MEPLPEGDLDLLRAWTARVQYGYWTHAGLLSWDSGLGFGRWMKAKTWAYALQGPLTIAATSGIRPEEQGLAGGLVNTSFQFGGALVLAIVTAVNNAGAGPGGSPADIMDGYRAALVVPLVVSALGVAIVGTGLIRRPAPAVQP